MKKFIEKVWLESLLPIYKVTTRLFPLLHSLSPPSASRQMFGSPQRSHFSEASFPPIWAIRNIPRKYAPVYFYKSFQTLIVSKQMMNTGESMCDT